MAECYWTNDSLKRKPICSINNEKILNLMNNQGTQKKQLLDIISHVKLGGKKSDNTSHDEDVEKKSLTLLLCMYITITNLEDNWVAFNKAENVYKLWFKTFISRYIRETIRKVHMISVQKINCNINSRKIIRDNLNFYQEKN